MDIIGFCQHVYKEVFTMTEAYCVRCRKKVTMKDEQAVTMKNGKKAKKGVCPSCGTKVFRIGG